MQINIDKIISKEEKFINELFISNSNLPSFQMALTLTNSLDLLSKDIYYDNKRFFYELLQNSDDSSYELNKILNFRIFNNDDTIIFQYNGKPFSEDDIYSITSSGLSTKIDDLKKTGSKGIGFKSIFKVSGHVTIFSGNFCFRFDKEYWSDVDNFWKSTWGDKENYKDKLKYYKCFMPWHIIPIWTDLTQEEYFNELKNYKVNIIIKPKNNIKYCDIINYV